MPVEAIVVPRLAIVRWGEEFYILKANMLQRPVPAYRVRILVLDSLDFKALNAKTGIARH
jgi:hypothetical protein